MDYVDTPLMTYTGLSLIPLLALGVLHTCFPQWRQYTEKFYRLSYYDPTSNKYGIGTDDFYVVLYWIVLLTGLRAGLMSYVLQPFARWSGVKRRKGQVRFAEQAWLFLYDASFFSLGLVGASVVGLEKTVVNG